jgi:sensor histidine kinase regulating citrate/malate metabolism
LRSISQDQDQVKISIKDSGSGIIKINTELYLNRGLPQKKRGWGLGLSLTKRIVEEYHKGSIKVLQSEIGKERCKLYLKKM